MTTKRIEKKRHLLEDSERLRQYYVFRGLYINKHRAKKIISKKRSARFKGMKRAMTRLLDGCEGQFAVSDKGDSPSIFSGYEALMGWRP